MKSAYHLFLLGHLLIWYPFLDPVNVTKRIRVSKNITTMMFFIYQNPGHPVIKGCGHREFTVISRVPDESFTELYLTISIKLTEAANGGCDGNQKLSKVITPISPLNAGEGSKVFVELIV